MTLQLAGGTAGIEALVKTTSGKGRLGRGTVESTGDGQDRGKATIGFLLQCWGGHWNLVLENRENNLCFKGK